MISFKSIKSEHSGYSKLTRGLFALFATLLVISPVFIIGCRNDLVQFQGVAPTSEFSLLMVPDTNLDVYVYAKQKSLTTIPADIIYMSHDIQVESLAIWGVHGEQDMAFGVGLTFDSEDTASEIYNLLSEDTDLWKLLRGNNLYVVKGSSAGADSLKTAIQNNNFKNFDNAKLIEAANILPKSVKARLIGMALAKPSKQFINFVAENVSYGTIEQINEILRMANLESVIAGLYSPHGINIARAVQVVKGDGKLADLDLGLLVAVKSGLPGFLVEPRVKSVLLQQGLVETKVGGFNLYKGYWSNPYTSEIPVLVRIEGNYVFISVSGQEAYAETLITSIYK